MLLLFYGTGLRCCEIGLEISGKLEDAVMAEYPDLVWGILDRSASAGTCGSDNSEKLNESVAVLFLSIILLYYISRPLGNATGAFWLGCASRFAFD